MKNIPILGEFAHRVGQVHGLARVHAVTPLLERLAKLRRRHLLHEFANLLELVEHSLRGETVLFELLRSLGNLAGELFHCGRAFSLVGKSFAELLLFVPLEVRLLGDFTTQLLENPLGACLLLGERFESGDAFFLSTGDLVEKFVQ